MAVGAISIFSAPSGVGSRGCRTRGRRFRWVVGPSSVLFCAVFLVLGFVVFRALLAGAGCKSVSGLAVSSVSVCVAGGVSGCASADKSSTNGATGSVVAAVFCRFVGRISAALTEGRRGCDGGGDTKFSSRAVSWVASRSTLSSALTSGSGLEDAGADTGTGSIDGALRGGGVG